MSKNKLQPAYPCTPTFRFALTALLNAVRRKTGLTIRSLAFHTGLPASTWSRTFDGFTELTLDRTIAAASYLGVSPAALFVDACVLCDLMQAENGRFASITGAAFLLEDSQVRTRLQVLRNNNVIVWV